ncbi:hypothetical protein OJF2_05940 [Aquisphaera giovannonii]|uniref:Uncharacterized protein n=1 Tax=Aquisphaera giovannonii TaxID=406548 RepID=A0A5B9VWH1_9BACT|nr:hypothetical protein [Aquisphaera giovannonii]QEH32125.1 hypothetical protein OJF2_05940 [Aquisphaera giovannonii]
MGHCEMLLAVAGLDQNALEERTRLLASKDWTSLPPYDRAAFFFAKKFSKEPWTIDDSDRARLIAHFGRYRALDVIWWASRCHYMTRVADGFQLPLERENVFAPPPSAEAAKKKP